MSSFPQYPTGWLCPRCNQINAPTVTCCQCGQRTGTASQWVGPELANPSAVGYRAKCGMMSEHMIPRPDVERYSTRPPAA